MRHLSFTLLLLVLVLAHSLTAQTIRVGADQIDQLVALSSGRQIALVVNQSSVLSDATSTHLVDTLMARGVKIAQLFSPEHGFRGTADAGASVSSGRDPQTGLRLVSLYGKNKKPTPQQMKGIDVVFFDLQDVGVRFFTYISTLKYVMEACASSGTSLVVLDRPNPHDTVDGPMLQDSSYESFISLLPIPAVHGVTMGEMARMIQGERWCTGAKALDLRVITVEGWNHGDAYDLPVAPSPNLKSPEAIRMYPTLCYFEATTWSVGRGTDRPFEQIGYPEPKAGEHSFVPTSRVGATQPKHEGQRCHGPKLDAADFDLGINLEVIIAVAQRCKELGLPFIDRKRTFDLLSGNSLLRHQISDGKSAEEIRASWQVELRSYERVRAKYLLYTDYDRVSSTKGSNERRTITPIVPKM